MNATSMRRRAALLRKPGGIDWGAVAVWALCFGLVVYLGMKGGGYDPLVHDPVGIAAWWIALGGVAVGALPRGRTRGIAWVALGLLAAFVLWTALSLSWTESTSRTSADLARVAGYLGIFALAVLTRVPEVSTRLGKVAETVDVVAPGLLHLVMTGAYHVFPDSAPKDGAAKNGGGRGKPKPKPAELEEISPEGAAMAFLMKGIHF